MDTTRRRFTGLVSVALALPLAFRPGRAAARADSVPLLLAREAASDTDPAGYLVSEKFDGVRALWDGQTLRFRSGLPVPAPGWFTARLPAVRLDGELWLARGGFEAGSGFVRRQTPRDDEWRQMHYLLFEQPGGAGDFALRAARLREIARATDWPQLVAVEQVPVADREALQRRLVAVVRAGGEGLVLHRADAPYRTGRGADLLKLKPLHDAEAVVVGHQAGQGRLAGCMGALRVRTAGGAEFLLGTGFSDAQRADPPPTGTLVTYTYRGRTAQGLPRFASFLRLRDPVL
jgi:DNA ligase-1